MKKQKIFQFVYYKMPEKNLLPKMNVLICKGVKQSIAYMEHMGFTDKDAVEVFKDKLDKLYNQHTQQLAFNL